MKNSILLILAISICGCSSDSDSVAKTTDTNLKLIKVVETVLNTNAVTTQTFLYSSGKVIKSEIISSGGDAQHVDYMYQDERLTGLVYSSNSNQIGSDSYFYTGELISSRISQEDNQSFMHTYNYNSIKQLVNSQQSQNGIIQSDKNFEHDSSGNINKITYVDSNAESNAIYQMEYDNYKNPFSLVYSEAILKSISSEGYLKNNVLKKISNFGQLRTYEYIYTTAGYPSQVIEKEAGVATLKTVYTYQ